MADDFMKQLQLTKQIEQKAKEAAKNRKTAEERLAQAEIALNEAKATDGNVVEADRFLVEATKAFKEKDYKSCLSSSIKSIEASRSTWIVKIDEVVASVQDLIPILERREVHVVAINNILGHVKSAMANGELDPAMHSAKEAWEKAKKLAHRLVTDALGQAERAMAQAEGFGLSTDAEKAMVEQAWKKLDEGLYKGSLDDLESCMGSLQAMLSETFRSKMKGIRDLQSYAFTGQFDLERAKEGLEHAQKNMDSGDIDSAMTDLVTAEAETRKALLEGMSAFIVAMQDRNAALGDTGSNVNDTMELISAMRERLKADGFKEASDDMIVIDRSIRDLENDAVARAIARWHTKIRIAKMIRADITAPASELDAAHSAVRAGELKLALEKVGLANQGMDQALVGYQDVEAHLEEFKIVMARAKSLGLNMSEAAKTSAWARKAALDRDFKTSSERLIDSTRELQNIIQAHYGKMVINIEMILASALRMQADVSEESEALDLIVNKIKRNEYGIVETEMRHLSDRAEQRLRESAEKVVLDARRAVDDYTGPMDLTEARATVRRAVEALETRNYNLAYDLSCQSAEVLRREEIQMLDLRMVQAARLLGVMKDLECESITLKEKHRKAEEMRAAHMFNEAMQFTNDIIQFAGSIIKDELSRQMLNVGKIISFSRKKGVGVDGPEHSIEEAWRLLNLNKTEEAYDSMQKAMEQLRHANQQHSEAYDLIAEVRLLMGEAAAKGLDVKKAEGLLEKARSLFEQDHYEEARDMARSAHAEAERLAAPYIAPKRLAEATELLSLAFRMKMNTSKAEDILAEAEDLLAVQDPIRALVHIKEASEHVIALMTDGLTRDIAACKATIDKSRSKGLDVTAAELMVQKAESLLDERRYNDSWRAVELAKNELDQSTFMEQRANDYLNQAERCIKEVEELNLNVSSSHEVLRQATILQRQGSFTLATELSKKAMAIANEAAGSMIDSKLAEVEEEGHLSGLGGTDLESLDRKREQIHTLTTQRKFKDAMFLIEPFQDELRGLQENRERANRELNELEARVKAVESAGMLSEHARQVMVKARERFQDGSFSESRSLIARCNEDLASLSDMFESRQREVRTLNDDLGFLSEEGRKRNVAILIEQAEVALRKLDFEKTSLFLRRARAAMLEATGFEVGRYFEELMALNRVMEKQGMTKRASDVQNGQVTKMYDIKPKDLTKLRSEVESTRSVLANELKERISRTRETIGQAKAKHRDVSASEELLKRTEGLLTGMKLEQAFDTLAECNGMIGVAERTRRAFETDRSALLEAIQKLKSNDVDVSEVDISLTRLSESFTRDPERNLEQLKELIVALQKRLEDLMPEVGIDIDFLDDPSYDHWAKVVLKLTNQGSSPAKDLDLRLVGPVETRGTLTLKRLAPGETAVLQAEILPRTKGTITVTMALTCTSVISDQDCGYESEFEMQVG